MSREASESQAGDNPPAPRPPSPAAFAVARSYWQSTRFWVTAFVIWNITLFILSSIPSPDLDGFDIPESDKLAHFVYFAAGGFALTMIRTTSGRRAGFGFLLLLVLIVGGIGVLDEFHQTFTPGRSGNDPGDIAADTLGAIGGWICARFITRRQQDKPQQKQA